MAGEISAARSMIPSSCSTGLPGTASNTSLIVHFISRDYTSPQLCTLSRHSLGRAGFYGKRGELRQRYREGQEDQLGALGLVVNMIVLWNTIYTEAALEQLRKEGFPIREEDEARLSPLIHDHINLLGRYSFAMPDIVARGGLRPLRDPTDRNA